MKINKIELMNIGSYEGHNEFDISKQNQKGNIVVIGGKNGAGKTTLFTSIKLCLYGYKEAGYQGISASYKKSIKRLINDKAKIENNANAYVLLDLSILNGQEWDNYVLRRIWSLEGTEFEKFKVCKNGYDLSDEEIIDFENYLLNLIPPELFELYFFDGEQIADFFLEDSNNGRIKNAFLTICGYDTFDIIYKNFKRVSKNNTKSDDALGLYLDAEDVLYQEEKKLRFCNEEIKRNSEELEFEENNLKELEKSYKVSGGVSAEEWNQKILELKNEERIREEKNIWLKNAANEMIPYVILNEELSMLLERMNNEKALEKTLLLKESIFSLLPGILEQIQKRRPELTEELREDVLNSVNVVFNEEKQKENPILNLSKMEYTQLLKTISQLLAIDKTCIIQARNEVKASIARSQCIREEIEMTSVEGIDTYLEEKERLLGRINEIISSKEQLLLKQKELQESVEKAKDTYKKAEKELEKQLKTESVSNLTTRAILFLETLQKRLYETEMNKVQTLFTDKMYQLMRKEQFIDKIEIDDEFRIHVYKRLKLDCKKVTKKILQMGSEEYQEEYGAVHCSDILKVSGCDDLDQFVRRYLISDKVFDVMLEFDKATMSKGEKQVFIMALYWAIVQLGNKDIPFIIDTPFARIDTEHREHITEYFFKDLKGQVFIFSTDEEITSKHMKVIGSDLSAKFLIENTDNTKTVITAGKYFEE